LIYFWIPNPEMAIERVRLRKLSGGHRVPEADIRRRYYRGLKNFFELYRPLANAWEFYDNTVPDSKLVASGDPEKVFNDPLWARIKIEADYGTGS
jgi:predicted ABC-type ATPase